MNLDDIFVDARMEGCERMTTPLGWLQRRSGWAGWMDGWRDKFTVQV